MASLCKYILFLFFFFAGLDAAPSDYLVVEELQGGLSGARNYKVTIDGKRYVLRILNPVEPLEVRQSEIEAAKYAGRCGIGPSIVFADDHYESMIMDFIDGQTLTRALLAEREQLQAFLQTMKRLHESQGDFPRGWTVFQRIRLKLEKLKQSNIPFPTGAVQEALRKLQCMEEEFVNEPLVPCHNDLNALNVLIDETKFIFIDWTDAGMGSAFNDLGYFALVNAISEERHAEMIALYLGRLPSARELNLLKLMKKVNMLRIFASNFPAYEPSIEDLEQRMKRKLQIEAMLADCNLPPFSYFIDLHMSGQLHGRDRVIASCLSALRAFLAYE